MHLRFGSHPATTMKAFPKIAFVVAALATSAALSAATFEGTVQMKISDARGGAHELTQHLKNGLVRTDMDMRGRTMSVIMDMNKREITVLMPEQQMYMVHPMPDAAAMPGASHDSSDVSLEKTSETEKILGYTCTKYVAKSKDATTDLWLTEELGRFAGLGSGPGPFGMGRRAQPPKPGWEKALEGKDVFPLRVVSHEADGKSKFQLDVVAVNRESQPDSLFAPPEGYRKFDMGAMMQGMGMGGKPGQN